MDPRIDEIIPFRGSLIDPHGRPLTGLVDGHGEFPSFSVKA